MYTRRFDDRQQPPEGYSGTFISPDRSDRESGRPVRADDVRSDNNRSDAPLHDGNGPDLRDDRRAGDHASNENPCPGEQSCFAPDEVRGKAVCSDGRRCREERGGLLGGLLSRFSRGLELDDLLLIGILILLMNERDDDCETGDDLLLILGLLLVVGL